MKENILNSRPFETDLHLILSLSGIRFFNAFLAIRKERKKKSLLHRIITRTPLVKVLDGRYNRVELLTRNFYIKALNISRDMQLHEGERRSIMFERSRP